MKTYFILSILVSIIYMILKSKKSMHMLQQNWYNEGNRYLKWIITNYKKVFFTYDLSFVLFFGMLFLENKVSIIIYSIVYIIIYFLYNKNISLEQSKKPLVITARIKRLYITMFTLYLIPIFIIMLIFNLDMIEYYYVIFGLLIYLNYFIVYISNIINIPVERIVFNHFKRKAKNKLNSMTSLKKVGITGSYGKTSCKNALNDILNIKLNSYASPKSFNTMNGLMITINNNLDKFCDVFIAEMGAFTRGEIKTKSDFISPQYGILTCIGTAHLESFGSKENIQKAKFELIDSLPNDGVAVLNMDDDMQVSYKRKSKCKVLWVSTSNKDADVVASDIILTSKGTKFKCKFKSSDKLYDFETKLFGKENVYNILQALALAHEFGLNYDELIAGVKRISTIEHRLEMKKFGNINIIDDAYNSNPVGSKMAVDVLGLMPGKKIIVTPGMIELGDKQYEYNKEFGKHISSVCDSVILVGKEQTKPIYDGLIENKYNEKNIYVLNDVKKAFPLIQKLSDNNTYVLLENDLPDLFNEKD
ncbi:MAG: UDP-N-acetylmuramoyl-tripeptide--D-alanyl-D-alanine ligase [Tenericutes bacterium]|nr:UDP-N-acetylmuramoyl-tripeptide--D-alanyl-D-alanine ligase [Mycoplasmatota bacterium]